METLGPVALGFVVGMILFQMVSRWLFAIGMVLEKHWTYDGSPKRQRTLLWALPLVFVLHSGPWAIFAIMLIAFKTLALPHADAWNWFLAAVVFGMALPASFTILVLLRFRKLRAARFANARA